MTPDEPYRDRHRHAPSHFCEAIGGRRACDRAECAFCTDTDTEDE